MSGNNQVVFSVDDEDPPVADGDHRNVANSDLEFDPHGEGDGLGGHGDIYPDRDEELPAPESIDDDGLARRQRMGKIGAAVAGTVLLGVIGLVGYNKFLATPVQPAFSGQQVRQSQPIRPVDQQIGVAPGMASPIGQTAGATATTDAQMGQSAPAGLPGSPATGPSSLSGAPLVPTDCAKDVAGCKKDSGNLGPTGPVASATAPAPVASAQTEKISALEQENADLRRELEQAQKASASKATEKATPKANGRHTAKAASSGKKEVKEPKEANGAIEKQALSGYVTKVARTGQAWIDVGNGKVLVVQDGDALPNGAVVRSIDPVSGCVATSKGRVCP